MIDLPGQAIHDFHFKNETKKLFIHDHFGPKVEMDTSIYFRDFDQMPALEKLALAQCKGKILDVGAGAGSHALALQNLGKEVHALEISPLSCEVMVDRGVEKVICEDFFASDFPGYDTILLLMNGIGICKNLAGFSDFLDHCQNFLPKNGQIVFDSSDIAYLFEDVDFPENYYGSFECRYEYRKKMTSWFHWLYLDENTLKNLAKSKGWQTNIVYRDDDFQYLVVLSK